MGGDAVGTLNRLLNKILRLFWDAITPRMGERRCRYCGKTFQPSKYQPGQAVCSEVDCQELRRSEYRQQKLAADQEYRQVCQDSSRKWRSRNPDYWKRYREKH